MSKTIKPPKHPMFPTDLDEMDKELEAEFEEEFRQDSSYLEKTIQTKIVSPQIIPQIPQQPYISAEERHQFLSNCVDHGQFFPYCKKECTYQTTCEHCNSVYNACSSDCPFCGDVRYIQEGPQYLIPRIQFGEMPTYQRKTHGIHWERLGILTGFFLLSIFTPFWWLSGIFLICLMISLCYPKESFINECNEELGKEKNYKRL